MLSVEHPPETSDSSGDSQFINLRSSRRIPLIIWRRIQQLILWYGVSASIYVLLRSTVGGSWNIVALFNNVIPWCAAGGIFWGVIALFSKRRWLLMSLQIPPIILFIVIYSSFLQEQEAITAPENGTPLTVSTYNIFSVSSDIEQVTDVIRELDADIVGLQELGVEHSQHFQEALQDMYPYQALFPGGENFGTGILSRYPLEDAEIISTYENYKGDVHTGLMRVVVDVDGLGITVFVAHPPVPSPFTFRDNVPRFYDENPRDDQLDALQERIKDEINPVLVLCDCNATDQSDGYKMLNDVLDDAFRIAGKGLGFTVAPQPMGIPSILPLIMRVDFVWISDDFVVLDSMVGEDDGSSDHRPVVAQLVLK